MKQRLSDAFRKKCYTFIKTHYQRVDFAKLVKPTIKAEFGKCHFNAVAAVYGGRADAVWLVWGGADTGAVHFINSKDGKFFDETWNYYENQHYYIIRKVRPDEYENIGNVLNNCKQSLYNMFAGFIGKLVIGRNPDKWC